MFISKQVMEALPNIHLLGTLIVAGFHEDRLRGLLELPDEIVPVTLLMVGRKSERSKPAKLHFERKPVSETVSHGVYGKPW